MQNEWLGILKKVTLLMLLCFAVFIIGINLLKLADFIYNIDSVVKTAMHDETTEIKTVDSIFNFDEERQTPDFDQDVAHRAFEMGWSDDLSSLDLSQWADCYNILMIGSDRHGYNDDKCRADVIVLLRINQNGEILSMSIPRDTLITLQGGKYKGCSDKIGHSMYWSGVDELCENVERLLHVHIDNRIVMDNFRSFEAFMAIIGGVSTDKILEGKLGVQWIRNRSFKFGDIERCRRQQFFLKKSIAKLWRLSKQGNYIYSTIAFDSLLKIVDTDMTKKQFLNILYLLRRTDFTPENDYYTSVLPGTFGTYNSAIMHHDNLTCWQPDDWMLERFRLIFHDDSFPFEKDNAGFVDFVGLSVERFLSRTKKTELSVADR